MTTARIHDVNYGSLSAGPLDRTEIFFQGCDKNCPGCFSQDTHDYAGGREVTVTELLELTLPRGYVDGFPPRISICGGEPLDQAEFLYTYLLALRESAGRGVSVLLYTGYELSEVQSDEEMAEILTCVDIIVWGRYENDWRVLDESCPTDFVGSTNQTVTFLCDGEPIFHLDALTANIYNGIAHKAQQMEDFAQLASGIVWFPIVARDDVDSL